MNAVIATATIINSQGEKLSVTGMAREEVAKKGMDAAQITGAASSYARKYALNGLFAIDYHPISTVTPPCALSVSVYGMGFTVTWLKCVYVGVSGVMTCVEDEGVAVLACA